LKLFNVPTLSPGGGGIHRAERPKIKYREFKSTVDPRRMVHASNFIYLNIKFERLINKFSI